MKRERKKKKFYHSFYYGVAPVPGYFRPNPCSVSPSFAVLLRLLSGYPFQFSYLFLLVPFVNVTSGIVVINT